MKGNLKNLKIRLIRYSCQIYDSDKIWINNSIGDVFNKH